MENRSCLEVPTHWHRSKVGCKKPASGGVVKIVLPMFHPHGQPAFMQGYTMLRSRRGDTRVSSCYSTYIKVNFAGKQRILCFFILRSSVAHWLVVIVTFKRVVVILTREELIDNINS